MENEIRVPAEIARKCNLLLEDLDMLATIAAHKGISVHRDADTKEIVFSDTSEPCDDSEGWTPEDQDDENAEFSFAAAIAEDARKAKESKYGGE